MHTISKIFAALSRTEQAVLVGAAILAIVSASILIGIEVHESTRIVPARGGAFTEGSVGQPAFVNPILAATDIDKGLVRILFANVSSVAEKIELSEDGVTWNVRLKEGLLWSDGRKITSDDIIFTVRSIQDPEMRSPLAGNLQGVVAARASELELTFTLPAAYPFFSKTLDALFIVPKHIFADIPPANWRLSDYNLKPVGSGPFRFFEYKKEPTGFITSYVLERNPNYFGDAALLESVVFRFFPNSADLVAAFNVGSIDGFSDFYPEYITEVTRSYDVVPYELPAYYAVFLNASQHLALKEPDVRTALSIAVPRADLVRAVFNGRAIPVLGPLRHAVPEAALIGQTAEAAALLEEAGWIIGADGVRTKKIKDSDIPLSIELVVPAIPFLQKTAAELERAWKAIGVETRVVSLSAEEITDQRIANREYQALLFGNFLNPPEDLTPFWHSHERFSPGLNLSLYNNSDADELLDTIRETFDPSRRAELLQEAEGVILDDVPAVFLYSPYYLFVVRRDMRGVEPGAIDEPAGRFSSIGVWHVRTARAF